MTIIIVILIVIIIATFLTYNGLVRKRNAVKQSRSSIDVYLTQRFDLIPNLIETVKGYATHEQSVFENITKLRSEYNQTKNLEKASELNKQINNVLLIGENYPELKSSTHFLNLQKNLTKMEDQLQAARRLYNTDVTAYNTSLQVFPTNIVATIFGFAEESLFELEAGKDQKINVNL